MTRNEIVNLAESIAEGWEATGRDLMALSLSEFREWIDRQTDWTLSEQVLHEVADLAGRIIQGEEVGQPDGSGEAA
jgi:hypothetical protein